MNFEQEILLLDSKSGYERKFNIEKIAFELVKQKGLKQSVDFLIEIRKQKIEEIKSMDYYDEKLVKNIQQTFVSTTELIIKVKTL
jgi:hypothetical protein